MHRTEGRLADGREIFFYDDAPTDRTIRDERPSTPRTSGSELRYDPLLREWVSIAAARQDRTHLPSTDQCPLCPSTPQRQSEIPESSYDVAVFENRFPSFHGDLAAPTPEISPEALSGEHRPGGGRCEVICFTSDHTTGLSGLPVERMRTLVDAWADRTRELLALDSVEQVYCFENRGEDIGVTLHHPHGQIYGYPFMTPRTRTMLDSARDYRDRTDRNLYADVLEAERSAGERVVLENDAWTAFVPAWARWPVEVHLYPREHVETLDGLEDAQRDQLAEIYRELLIRCDGIYDMSLPYISGWHQAPSSAESGLHRLHLQLFSPRRTATKLKYLAGSESGMGVFVNDVAPEQIAARLRAPVGSVA